MAGKCQGMRLGFGARWALFGVRVLDIETDDDPEDDRDPED